MSDVPAEKELTFHILMDLWKAYESLSQGLRSPSESHLFGRLLQTFVEMEPSMQIEILYAKQIPHLINPDGSLLDDALLEGYPSM